MDRLGGLWFVVGASWLWTASVIASASDGMADMIEQLGLVFAASLLGLVWVAESGIYPAVFRSHGRFAWLSAPSLCGLAVLISATNLPIAARMWLSEGSLRAYAEGSDPDPPNYVNEKSVGLFRVKRVWRDGTAVAFVTGSNVFDQAGVLYAPDGLPTAPPEESEVLLRATFTHLYGPWYRFDIPD
ncbi:MAG TPA: hypothetical protein VM533_16020 [Fimbriiglobus sp.]|jgi:hypothetical protein|nr:hypothetical protein [Fimbriiglobus sp.]